MVPKIGRWKRPVVSASIERTKRNSIPVSWYAGAARRARDRVALRRALRRRRAREHDRVYYSSRPYFGNALRDLLRLLSGLCERTRRQKDQQVYYVFHRWLHGAWAYSRSHYHHHASTTTEAISGTSHPLHESVAYLANFSLAFLLPALYGRFAKELIPIYFVWFDIMNCAGHCNFECFPRWSQFGPLKPETRRSRFFFRV